MPFQTNEEKGVTRLSSTGKDYRQVFSDGARGLFHLLYDIDRIRDEERVEFAVQAEGIEELYQGWLGQLLERSEHEKIVFGDFSVLSVQKAGPKQFVLMGSASGERYDDQKHVRKARLEKIQKAQTSCTEKEGVSKCDVSFELSTP